MLERRKERLDRGIKVRTEGIYAISSWRGIAYALLPTFSFVLGMLILPLVVPSMTWQRIMTLSCIFALLALSFDFLAHFVGIVCLGGAFFTGVGGYISGVLNSAFGLPMVITIPIATIAGGVICTLFLLPCLPIRGIYFAIVSLMYPLLFARVIQALELFGGTDGLPGLATFPNIWVELYFIIPMTLIATFALRRLVNEDFGIVLRAIKDNDQAVRASNINITWYKTKAVFLGASIGCFAGACLAHLYGCRFILICSGLFHISHCCHCGGRRGHFGGAHFRSFHLGSVIRNASSFWTTPGGLLQPHLSGPCCIQNRRVDAIFGEKVSSV